MKKRSEAGARNKIPEREIQLEVPHDAEVWKPVVGAPGYDVSNHGRVRSWWAGSGFAKEQLLPAPRLRKLGRVRGGYINVGLKIAGRLVQRRVHRLMLEAFVGAPPDSEAVCRHLDGDPGNNRIENLAWGTQRQNIGDSIRHGTFSKGARHYAAKFSPDEVRLIRKRARVETGVSLAAEYGVSTSTINRLKHGVGYAEAQ